MKKIAILGATGLIGKPVTKQLINAGFDVTIVARDIEKAKLIFPNTPVIYGDLEDKMSLFDALKGQECVYLNLSVSQNSSLKTFKTETDGMLHLIEAAKTHRIERIAYLSSLVKDYQGENRFKWWVFDVKLKAVQILKGSGIPYTIFCPSNFMENLDKGGVMIGNKMNLVGESKQELYWISGADYGKQVVKSFELLTDENREYKIQGLESYTTEDAIKVFIQNYKLKKLRISKVPMNLLKLSGKISRKINYIYHILEATNKYQEKFVSQQTWDELGKPKETIKDYTLRIQEEKI